MFGHQFRMHWILKCTNPNSHILVKIVILILCLYSIIIFHNAKNLDSDGKKKLNEYLVKIESLKKKCEEFQKNGPENSNSFPCDAEYLKRFELQFERIQHKAAILLLIHSWEKRNIWKEINHFLIVRATGDKLKEMEKAAMEDNEFGFDFSKLNDDKAILRKLEVINYL